jgi:hypothetical protein
MDVGGHIPKIDDGPWPAFPADLTSIALVVATQCRGTILIHEKMFESRMFFADKIIGMGARIVLCDPHRAVVVGPSRLYAGVMDSPDIRAGWRCSSRRSGPRARATSTTSSRSSAGTSDRRAAETAGRPDQPRRLAGRLTQEGEHDGATAARTGTGQCRRRGARGDPGGDRDPERHKGRGRGNDPGHDGPGRALPGPGPGGGPHHHGAGPGVRDSTSSSRRAEVAACARESPVRPQGGPRDTAGARRHGRFEAGDIPVSEG